MTAPETARADAFLAQAKERVEIALDAALPTEATAPARLAEAMRYSTQAGGKRLRPALALAACRAVGGDAEAALPFACALEMIHTYSLIHDDLPAMDDDDLRRGRPTNHKVFGEALAILAGDALHTLAFGVILREVADAKTARRLAAELEHAAGYAGMVGGQVDDLEGGGQPPNEDQLLRIHERKTAALLRAATRGGAIAGGATDAQVESLGRFGHHLGLAFQIVDDVLDETGTAEALGKTPGKDREGGKMTVVALEGVDAAKQRADRERELAEAAVRELPDAQLLIDLARFVTRRDR